MEAACYYLFSTAVDILFKLNIEKNWLSTTKKVHPWKKIIQEGNIVPQETGEETKSIPSLINFYPDEEMTVKPSEETDGK